MQNFDDYLEKELATPQNLMRKNAKTGEREVAGQIMPMEAAAKALVAKAAQGDISAIMTIRLMTRQTDAQASEQARQQHRSRVELIAARLTEQLKAERAYDGQDTEIAAVAEIAATMDRLTDLMQEPDFEMVSTDIKTGHQTVSPVLQLRDQQREMFQKQLAKLRDEAVRRIVTRKNMRL